MADAIDDDTMQAVQAQWATDQTTLPELFPAKPGAFRLKPGQTLPYAQLLCEFTRDEYTNTKNRSRFDTRKVTLKCWGQKADMVTALHVLLKLFNRNTVLTYPSGARFYRLTPSGPGKLEEDPATKAGFDVFTATVEMEVISIRDETL